MNLSTKDDELFYEWYSDGLVGLIQGAKSYDESKGIKPSTYLCNCIKNEIKKGCYVRSMHVRCANYLNNVSLNRQVNTMDVPCEYMDIIIDDSIDIDKEIEQKLLLDKVIFAIETMYDEDVADDFFRIHGLKGYREHTHTEIAAKRGLSHQRISNRDMVMMRKLKWFMKHYDEDVMILKKRKLICEKKNRKKNDKKRV